MTELTLGGGCFWCLDAVFRRLKGVESVESGYAGGDLPYPTYDQVAIGNTGHAEVVQVRFDESAIPIDTLLAIFFVIHNPTTLNRQGADVGSEYRSIMLYANDAQKELFEHAVARAQKVWDDPIITEIKPLTTFYLAEPEHQDYFNKNPEAGYCQVVIAPKVNEARAHYTTWFKEEA